MGTLARVGSAEAGGTSARRVVIGVLEGEALSTKGLSRAAEELARKLVAAHGWRGKEKQTIEGVAADGGLVVQLSGLGKAEELTFPRLRGWIERTVRQARHNGAEDLALVVPPHAESRGAAAGERILRAAALATYRFDRYRETEDEGGLASIEIVPPQGEEKAYRGETQVASIAAASTAFLRDLANTPPNDADPEWMATQAREVATGSNMEIEVLGPEELAERGMNALLAVGGGSARKPRLVRLAWGSGGPTVALVGKGVTFDTGGISIKPAASMEEMKYDKCGACTALAVARAVAQLELPVRLRIYLPLVENMPDGTAYRPGDIVRCYNGKTVEVINTDAEGRMILADALAWAVEEGPDAMLEYSTLTGSCVVALGRHGAGLFTRDDRLAGRLLTAASESGEYLWRLPLWPEFTEEMKAHQADLKNSAGRWGGASQAAAFLHQFTGSFQRWAHLDIAGPSYTSGEGNDKPEATGYGLALTLRWLRGLSG